MFVRNPLDILAFVLSISWLVSSVRTTSDPNNPSWKQTDWKWLLQKLHRNIDEIYRGDRTITVLSGKYFKYYLKDPNDFNDYEAFEEGTNRLPDWLSFNPKKKKLQGVPTDDDIRTGLKIVFRRKHENTVNGLDGEPYGELYGEPKFVVLNVVTNRQPFKCSSTISTGSILFSYDIKKLVGKKRVNLLRDIATQLEQPISNLYLEIGSRLDNDVSLINGIRVAGPGDRATSDEPGFTVTWKIVCSYDIAGDKVISFLKQLSHNEDFSSTFKEPVLGWFVHSSDDQAYRIRRAIGIGGTPVATPSISAAVVRPTISPSPSAAVVKPTPSKSVVVEKTAVLTDVPPVVTSAPTEPPTTEEVTEKLTTTVKITTKPTVRITTKEPTEAPTTKPPTEEPTTEAPTEEPTTEAPTEELTTKPPTQVPTTLPPKAVITMPPGIENKGPKIKNEIQRITLIAHQAETSRLESLFSDPDNDPLSVELRYYYPDRKRSIPSPHGSWIEYKDKNLYLLPKKANVGTHTFELTATDLVSGKFVNDVFTVVVQDDNTFYNILFNITVNKEFSAVNQSAKEQVNFVQGIADATNEIDIKKLRRVRFYPGSVIVEWGLNDPNFYDCGSAEADKYFQDLDSDKFKTGFEPAGILAVDRKFLTSCEPDGGLRVSSENDDNLWQRILIPVIVIVILLLIIALILCCVYRRNRKGSMDTQEDKAYLNHKKPVIFLEEFEEKPHFLSLQPLILPNEKPPVTEHPYEPRADTPEGPGSSTESTQSDEKPLTPQSPKDSSRKGYNAPPPYNSLS